MTKCNGFSIIFSYYLHCIICCSYYVYAIVFRGIPCACVCECNNTSAMKKEDIYIVFQNNRSFMKKKKKNWYLLFKWPDRVEMNVIIILLQTAAGRIHFGKNFVSDSGRL